MALVSRGMTFSDLAKKLGISSANLSYRLRKCRFNQNDLDEIGAAVGYKITLTITFDYTD